MAQVEVLPGAGGRGGGGGGPANRAHKRCQHSVHLVTGSSCGQSAGSVIFMLSSLYLLATCTAEQRHFAFRSWFWTVLPNLTGLTRPTVASCN